jgi:hypothetical protein
MKLFLDTEFTLIAEGKLVSLGLVAETGEEFYAELPVVSRCSDFVRDIVMPLLGREAYAECSDEYELRMRLLTWLAMVKQQKPMTVCFDSELDWAYFKTILGTVPEYCIPRLLDPAEVIDLLRESFFQQTGLPEHHALYDARALCYSFREKTGCMTPS